MKCTEHSAVGLYLESAGTWIPPKPVSLAYTKPWLACDGKLTGDSVGSHVALLDRTRGFLFSAQK